MRLPPQLEIDFPAPVPLDHADHVRLGRQRAAVRAFMAPGEWRTLAEITAATGEPEASVSARLRDFRRPRFGGHTVERRRRGGRGNLWEYRLTLRGEP